MGSLEPKILSEAGRRESRNRQTGECDTREYQLSKEHQRISSERRIGKPKSIRPPAGDIPYPESVANGGAASSLWWKPGERRERGGARLTRRVREEYRVYFDRNATPSAAKRRGSGGMHRRSNAAGVSPQAASIPAAMANRSRQTFLKRRKEKERVARQRAKELRRRERSIEKERGVAVRPDGDQDLMGIVPGPQEPVWKMADVLTEDERSALEEEEEEEEAPGLTSPSGSDGALPGRRRPGEPFELVACGETRAAQLLRKCSPLDAESRDGAWVREPPPCTFDVPRLRLFIPGGACRRTRSWAFLPLGAPPSRGLVSRAPRP